MEVMLSTVSFLLIPFAILHLKVAGINAACNSCPGIETSPSGFTSATYLESDDFLDNPDRGFYKHLETQASNYRQLTVAELDGYRQKEGITLALRMFVLDGLSDSPLPASLLQHIRSDLTILRQAGWTTVVRFAYTTQLRPSAPYGDAPKIRMMQHIGQLKAVWQAFPGTIAVIQAGFIGTWGEWYYTTEFGDPQHPVAGAPHSISLNHWQDRREILSAVLDAAPKSVPTQIPMPKYKIIMFGTVAETGLSEVMNGTYRGRTGHHNDCFLAGETDKGTYEDVLEDKAYLQFDTLYLPMGGETCEMAPLDADGHRRTDCPTAEEELRRFHWSFINNDYSADVIGDWKSQGCYDDIRRQLGYRLFLKNATLPSMVRAGSDLCYHLVISNSGYAAPYKDWTVSLVLRSSSAIFAAPLPDVNVRTWLHGLDYVITGAVKLPPTMDHGLYSAYLALVEPSMAAFPDSYVLLANANLTDGSSGLNPLHINVQVTGRDRSDSTCPLMSPWTPPSPSNYPRVHRNSLASSNTCTPVTIDNPSFEKTEHDSWADQGDGYFYTTTSPKEGKMSIYTHEGGANQMFSFTPPVPKLIITAYSRHSGRASEATADYSLYCDLQTAQGSHVYGKYEPFTSGNPDWHKVQLNIDVPEGISIAYCNLLYRNMHNLGGTAFFDDVRVWSLPASASFSDCPT